jgi:hypothetical protein
MAELKAIPFDTHLPVKDDEERNELLRSGTVRVETHQEQSVLSSLPGAEVGRLADAMTRSLDRMNADAARTKETWCWHLALTRSTDGRGQPGDGGSGKSTNKDTQADTKEQTRSAESTARLQAIRFEAHLPVKDDAGRNEALRKGIVRVETHQDEAILSSLPRSDVDPLAGAMTRLLDLMNADSERTKEIWCWHLALTRSTGGRGEGDGGGSGKSTNKDTNQPK